MERQKAWRIAIPSLLSLAIGVSLIATETVSGSNTREDTFSYQGEPINPALIREFEPLISDERPPITVKLNVSAAYESNEYFNDVTVTNDDRIKENLDEGYFSYEVLGRIGDTYVLRTYASGGGSGIFQSLLFVRLSKEAAFAADGLTKSEYTFMSVTRRFPLGDRDRAKVTLSDDEVIVGASQYRDKPVRLTIDVSGKSGQ